MRKIMFAVAIVTLLMGCQSGTKPTAMSTNDAVKSGYANIDDALQDLLTKLSSKMAKDGTRIIIEDVFFESSQVPTKFSMYLKDMMGVSCAELGLFKVVHAKKDYSGTEKMGFSYVANGVFDGILRVRYYILGEDVKLTAQITEREEPTVMAASSVTMPKKLLPTGLSLKPANFDSYTKAGVENAVLDKSDFIVKMYTERGAHAVYKDGESFRLKIKASKDCYIKLFHVDVNNKVNLIFPNGYSKKNFIKAGEEITVPTAAMEENNFKFVMSKPYGVESIRLLAQSVQFSDVSEDTLTAPMVEIGTLDGTKSRGLVLQGMSKGKEILKAEAFVNYTVNE